MLRARSLSFALLSVCCLLAAACGAPMAGTWRGTFDRGPVAAQRVVVQVQEDGQRGFLDMHEAGKSFSRFQICSLDVSPDRKVSLVYDANRPNCDSDGSNRDPSERRVWQGEVGEALFHGDVVSGSARLGFFRLFRDAERLPAEATGSQQ